jgi:tetratricopeptide (TPR) repeat protein
MKIKPKADEKGSDSREALLAPDEFLTTTGRAFNWLQDNSQKVVTVIAVFFGVALLVGVASFWQARRNSSSSLDLAVALRVYHRPVSTVPAAPDATEEEKPFATAKEKYTAARDALKPVVEKHGGRGAGALGLLYLADCQLHLGDMDEAVASYKSYLGQSGGGDTMRFLALQGLAHALEAKGDAAGAAKALREASELETKVDRDYALYAAGRLLVASATPDDKTQGKQMLQRVVKEHEASPYKTKAEELLGTLP